MTHLVESRRAASSPRDGRVTDGNKAAHFGTDAEVLIEAPPALSGSALDAVLAQAAEGIRAALADLDSITSVALAHAPSDLHYDHPEVAGTPLEERLFLEGFRVTSSGEMEGRQHGSCR